MSAGIAEGMESTLPIRRARPALGTIVEIRVDYAPSPAVALAALAEAFEVIARIESKLSAFQPGADPARIAGLAAGDSATISAEFVAVWSVASLVARDSSGAFDPVRAGGARRRLGLSPAFVEALPDEAATHEDLEIDTVALRARVRRRLAVDLGGVAKGYAAQCAAEALSAVGCRGSVDAGGDLAFTEEASREITLRAPDGSRRPVARVTSEAKAVAGSATEPGTHLILDTRTGAPAQERRGVTVFAQRCDLADALTKAAFFLDEEAALKLLRKHAASACIIGPGGEIRLLN